MRTEPPWRRSAKSNLRGGTRRPLRYDLRFEGVETNEDGLIAEADLFEMFDRSINVLEKLEDTCALQAAT